ncbi:MAG TPA: MFS transporter [Chloroflexota bacterium]|nr:MFS transporter [Chloroflexota bacterium]
MTSHRIVTLFGGLAFASMGMNTALVSFALLGMRSEWQLGPTQVSLVIASAGVGQLVGSLLLGNLSDTLGRKRTYAIGVALQTGFTGLTGLAPSLAAVCTLLFLAGLGQGGGAPVVTSMVTEAAPTASRGRMVGVTELMFASGWTIAAFLGRALAQGASWRLLMGFGGVAVVLVPLGLWLLKEQPPAEPPFASRASAEKRAPWSGLATGPATLWRPALRRQTGVLWLLWLAVFAAWFGPVLWLPTLFASIGDPDPAGKGSFVALAMLGGAALVLLIIDRLGRRPLVIPGLAIMAAACGLLGAGTSGSWLLVAGLALGLAGQCIWPVCLTYAAELYPTSVRGLGVGWALGAGRLGAMLAPLVLGALIATQGQLVAMLPFAALTAAAAVVVTLAGPETAGHDFHAHVQVHAGAVP